MPITISFKSPDELFGPPGGGRCGFDRTTNEKLHAIWFKAAIKSAFHPEMEEKLMAKAGKDGLEMLRVDADNKGLS